jgi:hypothetical protein
MILVSVTCCPLRNSIGRSDIYAVRLEISLADSHVVVSRVAKCIFICDHCSTTSAFVAAVLSVKVST